jgi:hypothetical protein
MVLPYRRAHERSSHTEVQGCKMQILAYWRASVPRIRNARLLICEHTKDV